MEGLPGNVDNQTNGRERFPFSYVVQAQTVHKQPIPVIVGVGRFKSK